MDHVAIMNKSWKLIPKVVSGEKKIESRWYQTRRAPWNNINTGDRIFFKNSGESVIAMADVSNVLQFIIKDKKDAQNILDKHAKDICLLNTDIENWKKLPKYCILVFLENAKYIDKPFQINKKGFGISTAWICVNNIKDILL
jgi:ASC-1-like (ASCH) protein